MELVPSANAKAILCLLFALLSTVSSVEEASTDCKPRPILIATGRPNEINTPSHTWTYKCSGRGKRIQPYHSCVATKWKTVTVNLKTGPRGDQNDTFMFKNHTECTMACTCNIGNRNQQCENNNEDILIECPKGSKWDYNKCECKVPNSPVLCAKDDEATEMSVSVTMFVVALAIEFVIVLIVIFLVMDACKYRNDSGILHKTAEYVRAVSHKKDDRVTLKRDRNDTGSESFLNGYSTVSGKINHV